METYQGKILKCGAYKLDTPETFTYQGKTITNTHRLSMQLQDESWVSFGGTDKDNFIVKDKQGRWKVLGGGSEVFFKYKTNTGKNGQVYKNAKKSDLMVTSLVEGKQFNAPAPTRQTTSGVNPAERGQIMNFATSVLDDWAEASQEQINDITRKFYVLQDKVDRAMTQPSESVSSDDFDDDPFS